MSFNLIDAAKGLLSNDVVSKAAGSLGESEAGIQKALSGAIPSVFAGLLNQSSGTGAAGILDLVKNAAGSGILSNVTSLFSGGGSTTGGGMASTVMGWLKSLFGDKLGSISSALAGFAGIKPSSANAVLSMATPAVLAPIGTYAKDNNLSASGLGSFLQSQKNAVFSALPPGFNLAGALGLSSLGDIGTKITGAVSSATDYAGDAVKKAGSKWMWPILLIVAAILIWLFARKGCNQESTVSTVDTTTATIAPPPVDVPTTLKGRVDSVTGDFIYDPGDMMAINLPNNGGTLNVGKWSTEARLVDFLTNTNASIDSINGNWFDFTNVRFKTGSSNMTPESDRQLKNLVMIIKAFPAAKFKIGGYTDNTGDPAANLALSQKRADAVAAQVVKLGATKSQITGAEGYGEKHPVGDNATAEGKAMNRRVSVNVKAK